MSTFLFLLFLWAFLTVFGHLSWLAVSGVLKLVTGNTKSPHRMESTGNGEPLGQDRRWDGFESVVQRLVDAGEMHQSDASQLVQNARRICRPQKIPTRSVASQTIASSGGPVAVSAVAAITPEPEVLTAVVVENPVQMTPHSDASAVPAPSAPLGDVIGSFLAARNIRWGEIVAGLLIVICSIGLVVSLWNTLTTAHRVIPSLIFLSANASIFAAGLYTLRRWKVRTTSRAVLIIATLLVPLSVLAGLAAAGSTDSAVQLTDPITLLAIVSGAVTYTTLLMMTGRVLVGRVLAVPMTLAVTVPAFCLPLLPAVSRYFLAVGKVPGIGWSVLAASIAVGLAWLWEPSLRGGKPQRLRARGFGNRLLIHAISGFAFVCLVAYAGFMIARMSLAPLGYQAFLPLAIACVPTLVSLAAAMRRHAGSSPNATGTFVSNTVAALAILATVSMLPAVIASDRWLWCWAIAIASSGLVTAVVMRREDWLAAATVPVGIAAVLTSSTWLGDRTPIDLVIWQRLICGPAMLVAAGLALGLGAVGLGGIRCAKPGRKFAIHATMIAAGWACLSAGIACVLAMAPESWIGGLPIWCVSVVLMAASIGLSIALSLRREVTWGWLPLVACFWISVFRPFDLIGLPSSEWFGVLLAQTFVCVAVSYAITAIFFQPYSVWLLDRVQPFTVSLAATGYRPQLTLAIAASVVSALAAVTLVFSAAAWGFTAASLLVLTVLVGCLAVQHDRVGWRLQSQVMSIVTLAVIANAWEKNWIIATDLPAPSQLLFSWSILFSIAAACWLPVMRSSRGATASWMRWLGIGSLVFGTIFWFTRLWTGVVDPPRYELVSLQLGNVSHGLPIVAFACAAAVTLAADWLRRGKQTLGSLASCLPVAIHVVAAACVVWLWTAAGIRVSEEPQVALSIVVSGILASCLVLGFWVDRRWRESGRPVGYVFFTVATVAVASAAIRFLIRDWLGPLQAELQVGWFPIWVVAAWLAVAFVSWTIAAAFYRRGALLVPASAAGLVLPVLLMPPAGVVNAVAWIQAAGIAALLIAGLWRLLLRSSRIGHAGTVSVAARSTAGKLWTFAWIVGLSTCILTSIAMLGRVAQFGPLFSPAGMIVSIATLGWWTFGRHWAGGPSRSGQPHRAGQPDHQRAFWSPGAAAWPVGVSLLAAQAASLMLSADYLVAPQIPAVLGLIWMAASFASLVRCWLTNRAVDAWHVLAMTVLTFAMGWIEWAVGNDWLLAPTFAALVIGGALVGVVHRWPTLILPVWVTRVLSLVVLTGGGVFAMHVGRYFLADLWLTVIAMIWIASWLVCWRIACPDRLSWQRRRTVGIADPEGLLALASLGLFQVVASTGHSWLAGFAVSLGMSTILCGASVAMLATGHHRVDRRLTWIGALTLLGMSAYSVGSGAAIRLNASSANQVGFGLLAISFTLTTWTYQLTAVRRLLSRWIGTSSWDFGRIVSATLGVSIVQATMAIVVALLFCVQNNATGSVQIAITAVGVIALLMAELSRHADATTGTTDAQGSGTQIYGMRVRHLAVGLGWLTLICFATLTVPATAYSLLVGLMRLVIAMVIATATLIYGVPWMLSKDSANRWQVSLRGGAIASNLVASGSIAMMLVRQYFVRGSAPQIADLPIHLVVAVGVVLVVLAVLAAFAAIASGPKRMTRMLDLSLTDRQRRQLILAAQVIGVVTWLHFHFCLGNLAFLGLRTYWPYVVMILAFVSVGATQWARRRGDDVLAQELQRTALFLPLIPLIGFWFSGGSGAVGGLPLADWQFGGASVNYEILLMLAAVYYLVAGQLWKTTIPRVAGVIAGNLALWIWLVQVPGWGFLMHPQAWLIPPAATVLIAAHCHRKSLGDQTAGAIRYAATLAIYLSSTADMLISDIGSTLIGPIALISLAMLGMVAGVIVQIRSFLYLGAMFVFVGLISMVWHAQQAINAVWPWWVFGITTGILLLIGLTLLEKNKTKLSQYKSRLATWQS